MRKIFLGVGLALALGVAYLMLWPVPIEPVAITLPASSGYTGIHAPNQRLAALQLIDLHGEEGPEHIAFGPDGKLYTTVASGNILRMDADGAGQQVFANTGGRVLGFDFDAQGRLIAADAMRGLLAIDSQGHSSVLADHVTPDDPIRYADAAVVARSGKIYFSDASQRFAPRDWGGTFNASVLDIMEQSATGRLLEYNPATRTVRVLASGLSFANGVALTQDERHVLVNETGRYRVWKVAVTASNLSLRNGPVAGAQVLLDNLPGYPDNLMRGLDGRIWLGLAKPRNPKVDGMGPKSWLRALSLRLPRALWPVPPAYGHVVAFTEDGTIVADLQDPSGAYPETTAVTETRERLYVQSLHAKGLGWLPK
ncbi:SMP-30/gluconolactonase/LRE family protein [Curvibacter sp. APW13]|uniref:SMP-30/gluconolactonase/LRE family protein n=1 Tax=Curvibacter sp. APW13 TaxID=3077236 RepID=UPI0028DD5D5A|nr:SMP-30/gluconolactonase/LRE family protein [Curvibacter sp. APW13]MDT8992479.1 SMP-30/gluconolactonase/LRE family protein [Curvibacter sp. APW13]